MIFGKISKLIRSSLSILLISHEYPDGDALGSMLALKLSLEKIGKHIDCYCSSPVPQVFDFLPSSRCIKQDFLLGDYDLIVILDCGDSRRTGFSERLKEFAQHKRKIINIDHHPKNDLHKIARYNIVCYDASSTSEIVYELIRELKIAMDKYIALNLLCGLYTDTGSFKHSNTTSKTLKIASELLKYGARLKRITENVINSHSLASLRLWGIALSRLAINKKYRIASSALTLDDIDLCHATKEDVSGIVNMINTIPDINVSLFLYQLDGSTIKGSLRTERSNINVTKIANIFGGGGLKKASGFTIKGKILVQGSSFRVKYS